MLAFSCEGIALDKVRNPPLIVEIIQDVFLICFENESSGNTHVARKLSDPVGGVSAAWSLHRAITSCPLLPRLSSFPDSFP